VIQQSSSQVQAVDPSDEGGTILPLLLENLNDPNPRARVLAVREVADYTDEVVITRLLELAERDPDLEVRCASISAMGNYIYLGGVDMCDPESELDPAFFDTKPLNRCFISDHGHHDVTGVSGRLVANNDNVSGPDARARPQPLLPQA